MKLSFPGECLTHDKIIEMKETFALVREIEFNILVGSNTSEEEISSFLESLKSLQKLILWPSLDYSFDKLLKLTESLQHLPYRQSIKRKKSLFIIKSIENRYEVELLI